MKSDWWPIHFPCSPRSVKLMYMHHVASRGRRSMVPSNAVKLIPKIWSGSSKTNSSMFQFVSLILCQSNLIHKFYYIWSHWNIFKVVSSSQVHPIFLDECVLSMGPLCKALPLWGWGWISCLCARAWKWPTEECPCWRDWRTYYWGEFCFPTYAKQPIRTK